MKYAYLQETQRYAILTGDVLICYICRRCYDMLYLQEMQTWSRGAETSPQVRPKSCSKSLETKMAKVWHWTDAKNCNKRPKK